MATQGSRTSLTVQYMPRTTYTSLNGSEPVAASRQHYYSDQPSPLSERNSVNSYSPTGNNGYTASEVSSVTGSVSSFAMPKQPLNSRYMEISGDSGNYSPRGTRSIASTTSYAETDLDSEAGFSRAYSAASDERFQGELYQPQPHPRTMIVQREVRQMYGETHPKNLPSTDLPSSGDELDSAVSDASVPSFVDVPRARPRASLRRKKLSEANSVFASDDESISSQLEKSGPQPKGILKNNSTDISDAESMAKSGNFSRSGSRRSVRFQHRDKATNHIKDTTNYDAIDKQDKKSRKKSSSTDPFAHMSAPSIKPARNDPKRSSGRSTDSRGSQRGRQGRSSSSDRSRPKSKNGSMNRSRSSSNGRVRTPSTERKNSSTNEKQSNGSAVNDSDVKIQMPNTPRQSQTMMGEILKQSKPADRGGSTDGQKICKWCLLIGVPVTLIVIVAIIVGVMVAN